MGFNSISVGSILRALATLRKKKKKKITGPDIPWVTGWQLLWWKFMRVHPLMEKTGIYSTMETLWLYQINKNLMATSEQNPRDRGFQQNPHAFRWLNLCVLTSEDVIVVTERNAKCKDSPGFPTCLEISPTMQKWNERKDSADPLSKRAIKCTPIVINIQ